MTSGSPGSIMIDLCMKLCLTVCIWWVTRLLLSPDQTRHTLTDKWTLKVAIWRRHFFLTSPLLLFDLKWFYTSYAVRGYGGRACLFKTSRVVYEVFQEAAGGGHYGKWACWQNCNVCGGWAPSSHWSCSGPGWNPEIKCGYRSLARMLSALSARAVNDPSRSLSVTYWHFHN